MSDKVQTALDGLQDAVNNVFEAFETDETGSGCCSGLEGAGGLSKSDRISQLKDFRDVVDGLNSKSYMDICTSGGSCRLYGTKANRAALVARLSETITALQG